MTTANYCCFNCDSLGGGYYKPHEGETKWFIGLDEYGQANYACEDCSKTLFNARELREPLCSKKEGAL